MTSTRARGVVTGESPGPSHHLDLDVLGTPIRLVCHDSATQAVLRRDWSRCAGSPPPVHPAEIEVGESGRPVAARDLYATTSEVTRLAIMAQAGHLLMIHACGLADEDGGVVALVGPSGSGKSTAARELCRDRFGYVTDETLAVDGSDAVVAYPKPLSLHDAVAGGAKRQFGPNALKLRRPAPDLHLGRIVVLDRQDHEVAPRLSPVPLVDALVTIIPQTSALPALEDPLQRLCGVIDTCGGAYRLTYSEIADAAQVLGDPPPAGEAEGWSPLVERDQPRDDISWMLGDGRIHPGPFADAVRVGDEALVLVGRTPMRLSGIGLTIWEASHRGPSPEELTETVVAAHGPHPDAPRLVRDAVETLRAAGAVSFRRPRTAASLLADRPMAKGAADAGPEVRCGV